MAASRTNLSGRGISLVDKSEGDSMEGMKSDEKGEQKLARTLEFNSKSASGFGSASTSKSGNLGSLKITKTKKSRSFMSKVKQEQYIHTAERTLRRPTVPLSPLSLSS